jgi:hypothetical protein
LVSGLFCRASHAIRGDGAGFFPRLRLASPRQRSIDSKGENQDWCSISRSASWYILCCSNVMLRDWYDSAVSPEILQPGRPTSLRQR